MESQYQLDASHSHTHMRATAPKASALARLPCLQHDAGAVGVVEIGNRRVMELAIEACHGHAARARSAAEARGSLQSSQIDVTGLSASVSDGSCDGGRERRETVDDGGKHQKRERQVCELAGQECKEARRLLSIVLGAQAVVHLPAEEVGASGEGQDLPRLVGGARGAIQRVLIVGHQVDGLAQAGVAQALRLLSVGGWQRGGVRHFMMVVAGVNNTHTSRVKGGFKDEPAKLIIQTPQRSGASPTSQTKGKACLTN